MPRYFFHVRGQDGLEEDLEGSELPDLDAVRAEALVSSKHMVAEALKAGAPLHDAMNRRFEVADETGGTVLTLAFAEGVQADLRGVGSVSP